VSIRCNKADYRGGFSMDDTIIWVAFVCYLLVALSHSSYCTVYFGAAQIVTSAFDKEAKKIRTGNFDSEYLVTKHREVLFAFAGNLITDYSKTVSVRNGQHGIEKLENNNYCLKTWGILTDDDINGLIAQQGEDDARKCVANAAKKSQWEILNTNRNK
jgi:hypothetical protein